MTIIQEKIMNNIILDYKNGLSPEKLSKKYIDYSPYIIRENLKQRGVFKSSHFTKGEIENMKNDYLNGLSLNNLSKKYGRSGDVIRKKLQSINIYNTQKYDVYSDDEISILKKYYPLSDWENLKKFLPNRDKTSLIAKAHKLGLKQVDCCLTKEDVVKILEDNRLYLLSEFIGIKSKHDLIDADGYLYHIDLCNIIYNASLPLKFYKNNPYTIRNIKNYIIKNNIKCVLLSHDYDNNTTSLLWECHCGRKFLCSWKSFLNGKHQCDECTSKIVNNTNSISTKEIDRMLIGKPYKMIPESFSRLTNGFFAITDDGYFVKINRDNLYKNKKPEIFHSCNPYTIDNIRHYIDLNNIETKLISDTYINNSEKLIWECKCHSIFSRNWMAFYNGSHYCTRCARIHRGILQRKGYEELMDIISKNGYNLFEGIDENKSITSQKISLIDFNGYLYQSTWASLKNGKMPEKFHKTNKFSIDNINLFLQTERNGEYICIDKNYAGNDIPLKFKHVPCGHIFDATLIQMQGKLSPNKKDRYYIQCPNCKVNKIESNHASILKQIFIHEYPDTILEDKTCINPKTNHSLPTDIVNHRLKVAIEIQSGFHDIPRKKSIDKFKKEFWINKGYSFSDPDIRDYSILEMVQIFFPHIQKIPLYVNYNFSNCIDFNYVQDLLNDGYTIKDIYEKTGINRSSIRWLVTSKKIKLPDNYKKRVFKTKSIVRLTKDNEFIKRYESLYSVKDDGFAQGTVRRVLIGTQNFSYNSFWVYEDDYLSGNYTIPQEKKDNYNYPVAKYNMNDEFICNYNSIYEAEENSMSNRSEIYRVAKGDRKSSNNEKWKFINIA